MIAPRASVTRFVRAVARAEGAHGDAPVAEIAQRMLLRLHAELGKLIGSLAFDVLLRRALVLARRTHPVLANVTSGADAKLTGLDRAPGADDSLGDAALTIVSHFVELLVVLIGEDLAMRLVEDVWPAVMVDEETR